MLMIEEGSMIWLWWVMLNICVECIKINVSFKYKSFELKCEQGFSDIGLKWVQVSYIGFEVRG
jgi:hypothetical protein